MKFFKVHASTKNVDNLLVVSGYQFPDGASVIVCQGDTVVTDLVRLTNAAKLEEILGAFRSMGWRVDWVES